MKIISASFQVIALLFILSSSAKAQDNDYIITNKNDTLKGQLNGRRFKATGWAQAKRIDLDSVKGYYLGKDSSLYLSMRLPGTENNTFVQVLEKGKLNLYELASEGVTASAMQFDKYWYISKGNDSLKLIKLYRGTVHIADQQYIGKTSRKKRENDFMAAIADNPDLLNRFKDAIKTADYTWELIRYYVKTYNDEYLESHSQGK